MKSGEGGNSQDMTTIAELQRCDGFTVEGPGGRLGTVEETWLDEAGHPRAAAVRTPDGQRGLLLAESVQAVDLDAEEVLVVPGADLRLLEPPLIASTGGALAATWRATDAHLVPFAEAHAAPTQHGRDAWHTMLVALACILTLIVVEIALTLGIADLVVGRPY